MDKPRGCTSHDVVARVRRLFDGLKVGHAGTLDPDATGVLVICLGKATKVSSFLMEGVKCYEGHATLGVTTDTQDASGAILEERDVTVGFDDVAREAKGFVGRIEQVPPMYSAVKVSGQKLYRLARQGVEVERPSRPVTISELEVRPMELPRFGFRLVCSKGTYVRTLVHDLGERLGCGGHLAELSRTRQGDFTLEQAIPWSRLEGADAVREIDEVAVTPAKALEFLPSLPCPRTTGPIRVGSLVPLAEKPESTEGPVRLVGAGGRVEALGKVESSEVRILYRFPVESVGFGRGRRAS